MCASLGNILTRIVSNSHFGKRPGAWDMTICVSHVFPMRANFHVPGWFLMFYYCHVGNKSELVYNNYGGWTSLRTYGFWWSFGFLWISHSTSTNTKNNTRKARKCICHYHHHHNHVKAFRALLTTIGVSIYRGSHIIEVPYIEILLYRGNPIYDIPWIGDPPYVGDPLYKGSPV